MAFRHGHQGGRRCGSQGGGLRPWRAHRGRVGFRDAEARRQGGPRAGRGIAPRAPCRPQHGQEHVDPLLGFPLAQATQAPLEHWQGIGVHLCQNKHEPILGCRQGAVLIDGALAGGAWGPLEAPRRPMRVQRGLKGRDELLELVKIQARAIQKLRRAGLHVGEPSTGPLWYLLFVEAQYIINVINLS